MRKNVNDIFALRELGNEVIPAGSMRVYLEICRAADQGKTLTFRQLGKIMNQMPNSIENHIKKLQKYGLISKEEFSARTIRPCYRIEMCR